MPDTIVESLGLAVRQLRLRLALSQEQLAERSGPSRSGVGEIERGSGVASIVTVRKLAGALETDVKASPCAPVPMARSRS